MNGRLSSQRWRDIDFLISGSLILALMFTTGEAIIGGVFFERLLMPVLKRESFGFADFFVAWCSSETANRSSSSIIYSYLISYLILLTWLWAYLFPNPIILFSIEKEDDLQWGDSSFFFFCPKIYWPCNEDNFQNLLGFCIWVSSLSFCSLAWGLNSFAWSTIEFHLPMSAIGCQYFGFKTDYCETTG